MCDTCVGLRHNVCAYAYTHVDTHCYTHVYPHICTYVDAHDCESVTCAIIAALDWPASLETRNRLAC